MDRESLCPRPQLSASSYDVKYYFERAPLGFYVTNGQVKGAMEEAGFKGIDDGDGINLYYKAALTRFGKGKE